MEVITLSESDGEKSDGENSVVEVEVPKRPTPPLIEVEEDEMTLNIVKGSRQSILASDIIRNDLMLADNSSETKSGIKNDVCGNNPSHWTADMIKFYNDDWGGEEEFIVEKIQAKMCKAPSLWQISRKDYLWTKNKDLRHDIKCLNCHHYGHHFSVCPEPSYVPKCYMCGNKGHNYHPCPNSKCLNCGIPTRKYMINCSKCKNKLNQRCSRCNLLGHHYMDCSDHWRLFHLTTNSLSVIVPDRDVYKSEKDMWCCNCGNRGHHQALCLQVKDLQFRDTLPFIISYKKAFEYNMNRNRSQGDPRKKFKEKRKENQTEYFKINDPHNHTKQKKFNLHHYNYKKFQRFKKHHRRRGNLHF